jgi:O-antigen/teichoic acid export membrane protein
MRSLHFTIAKNALSNVVRGGASAVVAVVLPHFLTHLLGPDRFAGWALMLQVAAYANYLDFGLQTAVARYLAGALERRDDQLRDRLLSNAIAILSVAGLIAFSGLGIVAWQLAHLFRSIPNGLSTEIGSGVLILGAFAALCFPLSAYTGALIGMQRNELTAIAIGASKLCGALAVVLAAHYTHSLIWLALCIGVFNLIASLAQYTIATQLLPGLRFRIGSINRQTTVELLRYCSTLSVWTFGMLLVSGLDVTLVGLFNFQAAGAYSIASTLIMFFTGLNGAAFSAMLAPVAILQARREFLRISRLVIITTRLNTYLSAGVLIATLMFGEYFVRLWVGGSYVSITFPVLKILLLAQSVRLVGSALGTVLVGMGLQRYGLVPVMVEGILNLCFSIIGMILIGATGVAWATLAAATIALTITFVFVLPKIQQLAINAKRLIWEGVLAPLCQFSPLGAWICFRGIIHARFRLSALEDGLTVSLLLIATILGMSASIRRTLMEARSPD